MKRFNLSKILALTICLEMIISPVAAVAQVNLLSIINMAGGIANQLNGAPQSQQFSSDISSIQQQQTPGPDKYFNLQSMMAIPGLQEYLALNNINPNSLVCSTLATTMYEARNEVCRIGITTDSGVDPRAQLNEMFVYGTKYAEVEKLYKNYSAQSNTSGQAFGVGCMKNAMQILSGFFNYRVNELDKLTANLEAMNNAFREASRSDLNAIEEAVAVLDGGDSDLVNNVKTRRPDLFDFGKRFNNPACNSMFANDTYNRMGTDSPGGLNAINQRLKDQYSTNGGKYSGESYAANHGAVIEDINKLADKVATQAELNFTNFSSSNSGYGQFLSGLKSSVSSNTGVNGLLNADFFSEAQTTYNTQNTKLQTELSTIKSELDAAGVQNLTALSIVNNTNAGNFDSEVNAIQNNIKNACLSRALSGTASIDSLMERVIDPQGSDFANKNASNFMRDKLRQILSNTSTNFEKKLADLQALEGQTGNRYILRMNNSYEVQTIDPASGAIATRVVPASSRRSPGAYFTDVINNCEAQFRTNRLGNSMSGSAAISRLRKLNQDYKALSRSNAQAMRAQVRARLIDCASPQEASNSVAGSCTPARFNTANPGFCANAAATCSTNMRQCTTQAQGFVTSIKTERTARVNNYKAMVTKNKQDIIRIFDTALAKYVREGEAMRGMFGVGFTSPTNIQREVPEGQRYLDNLRGATQGSPDGALLLEDPDKYVAMFKMNIENLKKSVKDQQKEILGEGANSNAGILARHVDQTKRNYDAVASEARTYADNCINKHDQAVARMSQEAAEQQKKNMELGEKRQQVCSVYQSAQDLGPGGVCTQSLAEVFAPDPASYRSFQAWCRESGFNSNASGSEDNSIENARGICRRLASSSTDQNLKDACSNLNKTCRNPRPTGNTTADENARTEYSDCRFNKEDAPGVILSFSTPGENDNQIGAPTAPAYCAAGVNSDRNTLDIFSIPGMPNNQPAGVAGTVQ